MSGTNEIKREKPLWYLFCPTIKKNRVFTVQKHAKNRPKPVESAPIRHGLNQRPNPAYFRSRGQIFAIMPTLYPLMPEQLNQRPPAAARMP
jgi:hypothetical protein